MELIPEIVLQLRTKTHFCFRSASTSCTFFARRGQMNQSMFARRGKRGTAQHPTSRRRHQTSRNLARVADMMSDGQHLCGGVGGFLRVVFLGKKSRGFEVFLSTSGHTYTFLEYLSRKPAYGT